MSVFASKTICAVAAVLLFTEYSSAGTIEGKVRVRGSLIDLSSFVISVEDIDGPFPPPSKAAVLDQKSLRFVPHVLPVLVGTVVEFPNSDPLLHNVFSISETKRFNLGLYSRGTVRRMRFDKPGVVPLLCNVHLEMSAFIVVLKNPYFARTAPDGTYRIPDVPPGRRRVRCWHEQLAQRERFVQVPVTGTVSANFVMD